MACEGRRRPCRAAGVLRVAGSRANLGGARVCRPAEALVPGLGTGHHSSAYNKPDDCERWAGRAARWVSHSLGIVSHLGRIRKS